MQAETEFWIQDKRRRWDVRVQPARGRTCLGALGGRRDGDLLAMEYRVPEGRACALYEWRIFTAGPKRAPWGRYALIAYDLPRPLPAARGPVRTAQSRWCVCGAPTLSSGWRCGGCLTAHLRKQAPRVFPAPEEVA